MTHDDAKPTAKPGHTGRIFIYSFLIIVACLAGGFDFAEQNRPEPVLPSDGLTKKEKLSDWLSSLRGTRGNTDVFVYEGRQPGGTLLVLGGTHPNEPAGYVAAVLLAENIHTEQGRVIVIPRANESGFTATEPQEAFPPKFLLKNRTGKKRWFRVGSRYANILDGWPDPIVYRHHPSGQLLSGPETRNLNRAYPGRENGTLIERVAFAIAEIVRREKVDLVVDLHEAAPEYPVINAIVAHDRAKDIAAMATVDLEVRDVNLQLEISPKNFHGLIHREIGDFTDAKVVLLETAGALQGRLRGATDTDLILDSRDALYHRAHELGKLQVPFPEEGISLEERVGRHLESIKVLCETLALFEPNKAIVYSQAPGYEDVREHGVGFFLQ